MTPASVSDFVYSWLCGPLVGGTPTSAAASASTTTPIAVSAATVLPRLLGPSLRNNHRDAPPIVTTSTARAPLASRMRPHVVLVSVSRPPPMRHACTTPVMTMIGTATVITFENVRTADSCPASRSHARPPSTSIASPPSQRATRPKCNASTVDHSPEFGSTLGCPAPLNVSTTRRPSTGTAIRQTVVRRLAIVHNTPTNRYSSTTRARSSPPVRVSAMSPQTDVSPMSLNEPASALAPSRPKFASEPSTASAQPIQTNRLAAQPTDADSTIRIRNRPPSSNDTPRNEVNRAMPSPRPTLASPPAPFSTVSINFAASTSLPVPIWKLNAPATTWLSADVTRQTTAYVPPSNSGTDASTTDPSAPCAGEPRAIGVLAESNNSIDVNGTSISSSKSRLMTGGDVSNTDEAAGVLPSSPACASAGAGAMADIIAIEATSATTIAPARRDVMRRCRRVQFRRRRVDRSARRRARQASAPTPPPVAPSSPSVVGSPTHL